MKIKQIRIFNYGKWHDVTIPIQSGLNILYGKNEAGKTTLISFIKGVLFGYLTSKRSHKTYIPKNSKDYGGQLEIIQGDTDYIIQRTAGTHGGKLTVLDQTGKQLDNKVLSKILGPFNRDTFNALYYFGDVNLKAMGKLKRSDLIYRIQRIGLAHSDEWIAYREALIKQAKRLYSPRGYKPPLNQDLKRYDKLVDRAKAARADYDEYQNYQSQIHQFSDRERLINQAIKNTNQTAGQLERDQNAWARYQKIVQLHPIMKESARNGFTQGDARHLRDLKEQLTNIKNQLKLTNQQIDNLDQQIINDEHVANYQAHQSIIEKLSDQFNDIQRELHDISLLKSRDSELNKQLAQLRAKYTVGPHVLRPLNDDDLTDAKKLKSKNVKIQDKLQDQGQKLIECQTRNPFNVKTAVIGGISGILIIAGLVIKLWLLSGLGAIILALELWLVMYKFKRQKSRQIQLRIKHLKQTTQHVRSMIQDLRNKYHYPDSSVDKWIADQSNLKRIQKLINVCGRTDRQIKHLDQSIHKYFSQWTFMNRELTLSSDDDNKLLQLRNYVNKISRVIKTNHQAALNKQNYLKQSHEFHQKYKSVRNALIRFYRDRQIRDADEFVKVQNQQIKLQQQQVSYHDLFKQLGLSEIKRLKRYHTLDNLKHTVDKVNQRLINLKDEDQQNTSQLTAVQVRLRHMVRNGSYGELQQRIANYKTEIGDMAKRWLEESLASQWINNTLNLATKGRVPKIEKQAQRNFQILTNQRYSSIVFNKSKIKVMRKDKKRFTLYELSKGTVQQLYLALVFAMAEIFSADYPMPILIDDGFTDFDITRKQAAAHLLESISEKLQVIYCTSDNNLKDRPQTLNLSQIK